MVDFEQGVRRIRSLLQQGNLDEALLAMKQLQHSPTLGEKEQLELSILRQQLSLEIGDFEEVLEETESIIEIAAFKGLQGMVFSATVLRVHAMIALGMFAEASEELGNAKKIYSSLNEGEKAGVESPYADLINLDGLLAQHSGDLTTAIAKYEQAFTIRKRQGLLRDMGQSLYNIGIVYSTQGNLQKAILAFEEALQNFENVGYYNGIASCYNSLRSSYLSLGDRDQAFLYEQKEREYRNTVELNRRLLSAAKEIASLTEELSDVNRDRIDLEQKIWSLEFEINSQVDSDESNPTGETTSQLRLEIDEKEREVLNLREKIEQLEHINNDLSDRMQRTSDQLVELEALKRQVQQGSRKLADLQEELEKVRSENKALRVEVANLKAAKSEVQSVELVEFNRIKSQLDDTGKELQRQREKYEQQVSELEKKFELEQKKKKAIIERLELEIKNLRSRQASAVNPEAIHEDYERKLQSAHERIKELESLVTTSTDEGERRELNMARDRIRKLENELAMADTTAKEMIEIEKQKAEDAKKMVKQLEERIKAIEGKQSPQQTPSKPTLRSGRAPLEEIISSSRLAERIYDMMQSVRSISIRMLAMRLGVTPPTCLAEIEPFVKAGYFKVIEVDSANPTITLL